MHIAVDMDDVVLDFVGGVVRAVNTEYGTNLTVRDVTNWELAEVLDPIIGRSWWAWLRDREWLWANFDAVPGAIGGVDTLRRRGHYMELVTSKPEWAEHNVWKWIGKWRPAFNRVTIVGSKDRKVDFTDAELLVDDKPSNCIEFITAGRQAILMNMPHNAGFLGLPRVHSWPSLIRVIDQVAG
jgi:5'(3')-deoxyribonucleotidase